jgi:hypothetical protein
MTEYAILDVKGEILNVVTTALPHARVLQMYPTAVLLDSLPDDVKQRYRYWSERP